MIINSHSEVDTFSACTRRHYYAHGEKLQRTKLSDSLQRGIDGHWLLQKFFESLQQSGSWTVAMGTLDMVYKDYLIREVGTNVDRAKIAATLYGQVTGFLKNFRRDIISWEIVGVEKQYRMPIADDVIFAFTVDLVVKKGNKYFPVDWKFAYNFYSSTMLDLLSQVPKYIGGLRALGFASDSGYYGIVRTREVKSTAPNDLYRLEPISPCESRINRTFEEWLKRARELSEFKKLPLVEWEARTTRAANTITCNRCSYAEPCAAENNGRDSRLMKKLDFKKSEYAGMYEAIDG